MRGHKSHVFIVNDADSVYLGEEQEAGR